MPRSGRNKAEFSTYHIILRGNERKNIFKLDDDKNRFLDTIKKMKDKYNYCVRGYCIMDNHAHIIINDKGKVVKISFRIKPGIDAHTHDFIQTGQIDSKFGVALENGEAHEIIEYASKLSNVKVVGVHCHIGSQIFDLDPFELAAKVMLNFIADVKEKYGVEIEELNLGGGFGIKYRRTLVQNGLVVMLLIHSSIQSVTNLLS